MTNPHMLDQAGLRMGQAATIILLLVAFIAGPGAWWLVGLVGIAQLMGALGLPYAPYKLLYKGVRRLGWLHPNPQPDHPEPHRFALAVGTVFNLTAGAALVTGNVLFGWALVWTVIALANLNFWAKFCLGCWMYYWMGRAGIPGFTRFEKVEA